MNRKPIRLGLLVVVATVLLALLGKCLVPSELGEAIELAGNYLARQCDDDGRFIYLTNLDPTVATEPDYNIVRHAGAVYALAMSHQRRPDPETRAAMLRAAAFLKRRAMAPVPGREELLAIWSSPEIDHGRAPIHAKLGSVGLGLVALMSVEQITPGTTSLDKLQRLAKFLVFMQDDDGTFYSKYSPWKGGRIEYDRSLYYPGEAALGLLMLYEKDPQPQWLLAAAKAMAALARRRAGQDRVEADHWALLATARLLPLLDQCDSPPASRDELMRHAVQICQSILSERPNIAEEAPEHGCFTDDGRTCPTATRIEGLLAALEFLPEQHAGLRAWITMSVADGVAFLMRSQSRDGPLAGAIPQIVSSPERRTSRRATEVRIDYVQHALSGMIQYEAMRRR